MKSDVLVLGAGPAGVEAALSSAAHGASVVLVDSAPAAGGQVYRASPPEFRSTPAASADDHAAGEKLRERLAKSRVQTFWDQTVWLAEPGFTVESVGPLGRHTFGADALIVATGTHERIVPMPGWTLPGVVGLGAATVLLKSQGILPGARTVVAGCGPLLLATAAGILDAGGEVAALVDLNGWPDVLRVAPRMLARPDLLARGVRWMEAVRRRKVPRFPRHAIVAIEGDLEVGGAVLAPIDASWRPIPNRPRIRITADAVAIGHGLVPAVETTRLLGARHVFAARSGWVPEHDAYGRTSVPRLYAAGDICGIAGAEAAAIRGTRAGIAAAVDLGKTEDGNIETTARRSRRTLRRAERFGSAAATLMAVKDGLSNTITQQTIVCRCEDVARDEIEAAVRNGATTLNTVKAATRCGMGPCQGRMCSEAATLVLAAHVGDRVAAGTWTVRPPLRPVPIDALAGNFEYGDIPFPTILPI